MKTFHLIPEEERSSSCTVSGENSGSSGSSYTKAQIDRLLANLAGELIENGSYNSTTKILSLVKRNGGTIDIPMTGGIGKIFGPEFDNKFE